MAKVTGEEYKVWQQIAELTERINLFERTRLMPQPFMRPGWRPPSKNVEYSRDYNGKLQVRITEGTNIWRA
jgi:hypothetical protein